MVLFKIQPKDVESGIRSRTNSIPVYSRMTLLNGESFMEGVNVVKNDLSQIAPIMVKRTPEVVWQIFCTTNLKIKGLG